MIKDRNQTEETEVSKMIEQEIEEYMPRHEDPGKCRTPMADLFEIMWNAIHGNKSVPDEMKEQLRPIFHEHIKIIKGELMQNFIGIGHFMSVMGLSDQAPCTTSMFQVGGLIEELAELVGRMDRLEEGL